MPAGKLCPWGNFALGEIFFNKKIMPQGKLSLERYMSWGLLWPKGNYALPKLIIPGVKLSPEVNFSLIIF